MAKFVTFRVEWSKSKLKHFEITVITEEVIVVSLNITKVIWS